MVAFFTAASVFVYLLEGGAISCLKFGRQSALAFQRNRCLTGKCVPFSILTRTLHTCGRFTFACLIKYRAVEANEGTVFRVDQKRLKICNIM